MNTFTKAFTVTHTVLSPYVLGLVYTIRGYSLSPPLFSHSCLAKARARWKRERAKATGPRSVFSDAVVTPAHAKRSISLPPFGQKEARNEHSGIRVAVHYTGLLAGSRPVRYIRRQYCTSLEIAVEFML